MNAAVNAAHRAKAWLVFVTALAGCAHQALSVDDQRVLDYASRPYNKAALMHTTVSLGTHNGVPLIAEFPCSDVCPEGTVRIIRYDLKADQPCALVGGVEKTVSVPVGIAVMPRTFCFPAVLVENWSTYRR